MGMYGISAVRIDEWSAEVAAVKLHEIAPGLPDSGTVMVDEGRAIEYHDVASLIVAGNEVRILATNGAGTYRPTGDHVRKKEPGGHFEYIESCDADGKPTKALLQLPPF